MSKYNEVVFFNPAGCMNMTKCWVGIVTPTTGNGHTVDISSAEFNNIISYALTATKNTAVPTSVPKISVKSISNTALVINCIEGSASLVSVLGLSVLQGVSEQFANVSGLTIGIVIFGN